MRRIHHLAYHDALTGLSNRADFSYRLQRELEAVKAGKVAGISVICIDLDRFKEVNDTWGHATGDALLKAISSRLRECTSPTDIVARLGGDEFVIIQSDVKRRADIRLVGNRLHQAMIAPFSVAGQRISISASVGIAHAPEHGSNAEDILKNADLASYQAKSEGGARWRIFEPEMGRQREARRQLESDLKRALENCELQVVYQPIYSLRSNNIAGFEALLRWHHPELGSVPPSVFIPIAEETGLIDSIGSWALQTACSEAATWSDNLILAVNLSPAQFRSEDLVKVILRSVSASGLRPQRLELEITETVLMHDKNAISSILSQLRTFGIRLALDDFGTGFSSLSYLQNFAFDTVKLDRSFIADAALPNSRGGSIIRATVALARSLGMETTAEGIETVGQLDQVRAMGCTNGQGYYFAKPQPANMIPQLCPSRTAVAVRAAGYLQTRRRC